MTGMRVFVPLRQASRGGRAIRTALLAALLCTGSALRAAALEVALVPFASGLRAPVDIKHAGDSRLFVVEQGGYIRIVQSNGSVLATPFLDINTQVSAGGEQGLLGLAFHPKYASNGFFYVNYTDTSGDTHVARFQVSGNPDVANGGSELTILTVAQPFSNHNGGDLAFGPDGYLYIALGDGGGANDPGDRSQNGAEMLGKMLRIDVDGGSPYAIPAGNPFVGPDGILDEIWAIGLRNPWRFSFDRSTGDLFIGDVGQGSFEEVDFQPASSTGGENYGWRCYEGNSAFNLTGCGPIGDYTFPIHEYSHAEGCSITGGFVYRGAQFPALDGHYFFADFCGGNLWSLSPDGGGGWGLNDFGPRSINFSTFGEDSAGELYAADLSGGAIYRIQLNTAAPACGAPQAGCDSPGKSKLILKAPLDQSKRKLIWKWLKGPAVNQTDFGNPVNGSNSYSLCLYAGTLAPAMEINVPGVEDWQTLGSSGYKYSATPDDANDGTFKLLLEGGGAGKSKVRLKGKTADVPAPTLPLNSPSGITVQLIKSGGPECWQADYPAASIDESSTLLKASAP
jgi:glucose/arabinose dehydrogenase